MAAQVIGISGSPVRDSNTDQAVRRILEHTGLESEFVKLSDLNLQPCRACLGCVKTNQCVVNDDGPALAEKFRSAKVFVLGGYTPYSSLDARTKTFMERMYCLRHITGLNRGKPGVSVVTTACPPETPGMPPASQTATAQIAMWMMEEGMANLGSLTVVGNPPCIRCGHGDDCEMSGVKMLHGADATVKSVGVHGFADDVTAQELARNLGLKLREAVVA